MMRWMSLPALALLSAGAFLPPAARAEQAPPRSQAQAVRKTTLQEQPFPGPTYHTLTVRTVIAAGGEVAPHTHPGVEMAYVLDGQALVRRAGKPDLSVKAGDSFSMAEGLVHSVRNTGPGDLVVLSTYVVDKTKPIASPAPGR